jgi:predicted TIM-barrel fold metal-dependent hydrolase
LLVIASFSIITLKFHHNHRWLRPSQDHALSAFGLGRVMYESNWFVPAAFGGKVETYGKTFRLVKEAVIRAGATAVQLKAVFNGNAKSVYRF